MQPFKDRSSYAALAAGGALATSIVSIAASQILLGAAILLTAQDWKKARFHPSAWLLAVFFFWTISAAALSADPAAAWPQIRKFYIYLIVPCLAAAFSGAAFARNSLVALAIGGSASALWSFGQYAKKLIAAQNAGADFTRSYIADRVTGFMSHWMTFGGTMMAVFLLTASYLLFARPRRWRAVGIAAVTAIAIVLSWARGVQVGALAGMVYLVWFWRRKLVLAIPLLLGLGLAVLPEPERGRMLSIFKPRGELDSNAHRIALWSTGIEIVKAHPAFGVGPEQVERNFLRYAPPSVPQPIPRHWWYGHLHNVYIQFSADRGIPAMLCIVGFFVWSLVSFQRAAAHAPPDSQWMLRGIAAVILGVLVTGIFEHNLADSEIVMLTLGLASLAHCLARPVYNTP